ncbi:branched-chain amino acid ABC transporter permease [Aneurinibacillus tyrosinisolvens]|uniref:branched-chain amino acid ABC transporter permease n=1 Tax=Aneurinibacillus tyrosinisolvens TaxID=1443435 RepID=UPI00063EF0A0|nr:branched-chain amino acid ABC transporter permease [Aneurinibacillus tyrosinisolvens]
MGKKRSIPLKRGSLFYLILAACSAILPLVYPNPYVIDVMTGIFIYSMLGIGLNIVVGYCGLLDLGYAAFYAAGAYTTALLMVNFHVSFWISLLAGGIVSGILGLIIGAPTLRLRSDYLAIVTLGFGEIIRIAATNMSWTGGPNGIYAIPKPWFGAEKLNTNTELYYLGLVLLIIILVGASRLGKSRIGRAWMFIREDESAAQAIGVNLVQYKLLAYLLGAVCGGFAGAFYAVKMSVINPESFTFMQSVNILMVVILGGMGRNAGVLLGALILVALPELLRSFDEWRMVIYAVGLLLLMVFRPQGLLGIKSLQQKNKTKEDKDGAADLENTQERKVVV